MNPYAKFLGEREPMTVLSETVPHLHEIVERIGSDGLDRSYAEGKWNARQIIAHLAQVEMVFATRFRFAMACDDYILQPFEQDDWIQRESIEDVALSLEAMAATRAWNLAFLSTLTEPDRSKTFAHPEVGTIDLNYLIERLAGHDLSHFSQLETIAQNR
ncbi:MAG TPA: DinB family protein [Blastocatellia bacterium]|nr:DinB family protein [Blastocatellia bacterium]